MQHWCRGIERGSVNVLVFFLSNLEETVPDASHCLGKQLLPQQELLASDCGAGGQAL